MERHTHRLELRRIRPADREEFTALACESQPLHRGWIYPPTDYAGFDRWLAEANEPSHERLLLCDGNEGMIVGYFGIHDIIRGQFKSAHLGYWVGAPFAGEGYMAQGMQLLLRHAFTHLGLHRLEANIQPGNEPSIALARGAGFRREGYSRRYLKVGGQWRDHERWAILAEEWRGGRA